MSEQTQLTEQLTEQTILPIDTRNLHIKGRPLGSTIALGERMKMYEKLNETNLGRVNATDNFIIRLDGRSFSNFTSGFKQPFDKLFIQAMCYTTADLLDKFQCRTAYCHSDEITLIFSKQVPGKTGQLQTHPFDGRIQKLLSLTSSYCSVKFNYHLMRLINDQEVRELYADKFIDKINLCEQMFDARIIVFSELASHEIVNHQIWRSVFDCYRNAVSGYGHHYIGHLKCQYKSSKNMIDMLESKPDINFKWSEIPLYIKYGFYCKKELYDKEINGILIKRSKITFKNFKITFSKQMVDLLLAKYWSDANESLVELIGSNIDINNI